VLEIYFVWVGVEGEHHFVQNVTVKLEDYDIVERYERLRDIDGDVDENSFEYAEFNV
jgi:hypothetical protein